MFDRRQQVMMHAGAAAILIFLIAIIGGVAFGAALVWGLLCGGVMLQLRRQNLLVAEGADILQGSLRRAGTVAGVVQDDDKVRRAPPESLEEPRGGQADDLKRIDGIGPKLEQTLHAMGYYHFEQIAGWTEEEVAWMDHNVEGVRGRVTRDDWVGQAKTLLAESGHG